MTPPLKPDARFPRLGHEFGDLVEPAAFPDLRLRFRNDRAARELGLTGLSDAAWVDAFGRFERLPGVDFGPLAMRYHGHQFRVYNDQIGDGRGFLFAQLRDARGRLIDLGTKGSGRTPWSRDGDGRLTLKGAVREILASEMLEALGVPTGRTLSVVETGDQLHRHDEPSPARGAVMVRSLWSHVRIGTFQRHAWHDRRDLLIQLADHVIDAYFPDLADLPTSDRIAALLQRVVERQAVLAARWMAAGFVHGVLNTDNLNVTGESFDYGPWRFLPYYEPGFTAAYFDEGGLYAYGRQAEAVFWNLQQLGACLGLIVEDHAPLVQALNGFSEHHHAALAEAFAARLGVKPRGEVHDRALTMATLGLLRQGGEAMRWEPLFHDWYGGDASRNRALAGPRAAQYAGSTFETFEAALTGYEPRRPEVLDHPLFQRPEPEEMLYPEVEAISAAIAERDDWSLLHAKLARIDEVRETLGLDPWRLVS